MSSKRQKWINEEDEALSEVLLNFKAKTLNSDDWETVARKVRERGFEKSAKQCRER
jgi:hypothetical protein